MSLHDRAVDEQVSERCRQRDGAPQSLPRSSERPTTRATIDPLPGAKLLRDIPPRCATSKYPSDRLEEAPSIPFWTSPRQLLDKRTDQGPPLVAEESTRPPEHAYSVAPTGRSSSLSLRELSTRPSATARRRSTSAPPRPRFSKTTAREASSGSTHTPWPRNPMGARRSTARSRSRMSRQPTGRPRSSFPDVPPTNTPRSVRGSWPSPELTPLAATARELSSRPCTRG